MTDHIGERFGNYRLVSLLGRGGFAKVYLGEHLYLKTKAAVKVLQVRLTDKALENFLAEARTIARLEHRYIVRVLECDVEPDQQQPFLVMSYASGGSTRQRYPEGTRLQMQQAVLYIQQVASALHYAHERKFIHRDVKPENILLGADDDVLLGDFGLVTIAQSSSSQSTKEMAGTVHYMAPEQLQGKPRAASDQYALGILAYEWLSGKRPFQGSFVEIASQHILVPPPPLTGMVPGITGQVEQVIFTALSKSPEQRFASVMHFADALAQACGATEQIVSRVSTIQIDDASTFADAESDWSTFVKNPTGQSNVNILPASSPGAIGTPSYASTPVASRSDGIVVPPHASAPVVSSQGANVTPPGTNTPVVSSQGAGAPSNTGTPLITPQLPQPAYPVASQPPPAGINTRPGSTPPLGSYPYPYPQQIQQHSSRWPLMLLCLVILFAIILVPFLHVPDLSRAIWGGPITPTSVPSTVTLPTATATQAPTVTPTTAPTATPVPTIAPTVAPPPPTVAPTPPPLHLTMAPTTLTLTGTQGQNDPAAQSVTLNNTGSAGTWTASSDVPWPSANPASGTIGAGGSSGISIGVNIAGLAPGTYTGHVTFTANSNIGSSTTILTVTLTMLAPVVISQGAGTLRGTWLFNFDIGSEVSGGTADVWWEQVDSVVRKMVPQGSASLVNLGVTNFNGIMCKQLKSQVYSKTPIDGNNDATNQLVAGDVFAVLTNRGDYAKVLVVSYGYNLQLQWVTYQC